MPVGVKRVRTSWKPADQAWRALANCLGYSTPMDPPPARVVVGAFNNGEDDEKRTDETTS